MENPFNTVVQILVSESSELRELAKLSDLPMRDFYRGADLRGVNLSGQDLTGLNFQKADLRGADLLSIKYDPGAFNGSFLDDKFKSMIDDYDFFIEDINEEFLSRMSIMYRFRPGLVDELLSEAGVSYREFAEQAKVSTATLRRVRSGKAVANESIFGVIGVVSNLLNQVKVASTHDNITLRRALQPAVNVGYYDPLGVWITVSKDEFTKFARMLEVVNTIRYGEDWRLKQKGYDWNMKPSSLEWMYHYYKNFGDTQQLYYDARLFDVTARDDQQASLPGL